MNNQIHNKRSAQSFFHFYRHAEPIPAPFTFKFYNSLNEWMDGWMDGWREEGRRDERTND